MFSCNDLHRSSNSVRLMPKNARYIRGDGVLHQVPAPILVLRTIAVTKDNQGTPHDGGKLHEAG